MNRNWGFTLVELMLTITILTIVMAVAIPPMADFINRYRSEVYRQRLFDLIVLSRGEAYSQGKIYSLCASENGNDCGGDWAQGALLFVDSDGDGERDDAETIERVMEPLPENATLEWNNNRSYLQFRPNGRTPWQLGNFAYCPPNRNPKYGWIIVMNATGRPYFGKDLNGDGIMETGGGDNLTCTVAS